MTLAPPPIAVSDALLATPTDTKRLPPASLDALSHPPVISTAAPSMVPSELAPPTVRSPELGLKIPSKSNGNSTEPSLPPTCPSLASNDPESPLSSSTNALELSALPPETSGNGTHSNTIVHLDGATCIGTGSRSARHGRSTSQGAGAAHVALQRQRAALQRQRAASY
jgi:hypothetical protein